MLTVTIYSAPSERNLIPGCPEAQPGDSVFWYEGEPVPAIAADDVTPTVHEVIVPEPWLLLRDDAGHGWLGDGLRLVGAWEAVLDGRAGVYGFRLAGVREEKSC